MEYYGNELNDEVVFDCLKRGYHSFENQSGIDPLEKQLVVFYLMNLLQKDFNPYKLKERTLTILQNYKDNYEELLRDFSSHNEQCPKWIEQRLHLIRYLLEVVDRENK